MSNQPGQKMTACAWHLHASLAVVLLGLGIFPLQRAVAAGEAQPPIWSGFIEDHCYGCHDAETKKGNFDLENLKFDLADPNLREKWIYIYDRVHDGEMPPKKSPRPPPDELRAFLTGLAKPIVDAERAHDAANGRATLRRLNRYEYENTLRDLFHAPWLEVKDVLPEDGEAFRFNKIGGALDISYLQMSRYLTAADLALREILTAEAGRPPTRTVRYYAREQNSFRGSMHREMPDRETFPIVGSEAQPLVKSGVQPLTVGAADPATREREAMAAVLSSHQPVELKFDKFTAPVSGRYRIRLSAYSVWFGLGPTRTPAAPVQPSSTNISKGRRPEPVAVYAQLPPRFTRRIGVFDAGTTPTTGEFETWLLAGETIRPDAVRLFRPTGPRQNPLATAEGMPGIAYRWVEVEGPIHDETPGEGYRVMFDRLPFKVSRNEDKATLSVESNEPAGDASRLLERFMGETYRRPATAEDLKALLPLVESELKSGRSFTDAMLSGYAAVLCSSKFLFLDQPVGPLDDFAVASRLSYFLWNSAPDETLLGLARRGALRHPDVLRAQTERMLDDPKAQRFVNGFLDYWLDLRKLTINAPDATLYPDYYVDDFLVESAEDETQLFFADLIKQDLPASNIVDANFTILNERLAQLYGIPGVDGGKMRRVALPPDSPRGGLLTQASVLKVTANGTTTSPVIRGAWITERILGHPPHPPPPGVGAIEPDTRGATTIRQQLDKHRSQATCAACHAKFDPAGFALENFDVMGGWRDNYRADDKNHPAEKGFGHLGQKFQFYFGLPVDAAGALADGRKFADAREFKKLLLADPRQIARNLTNQMVIYATGAPVQFSDRATIEAILDRAVIRKYGLRTLIHEIVESPLFLNK